MNDKNHKKFYSKKKKEKKSLTFKLFANLILELFTC